MERIIYILIAGAVGVAALLFLYVMLKKLQKLNTAYKSYGEIDRHITYTCPRCGEKIIAELNKQNDIDTRDFLGTLPVNNYTGEENTISVKFDSLIEITTQPDDPFSIIESIEMCFPTLNNCISASTIQGEKNDFLLELQVYVNCIQKINGEPVDKKWLSRFGIQLMKKLEKSDLKKINVKINEHGLNEKVEKTCRECGKIFEVAINTASFFDSALQ